MLHIQNKEVLLIQSELELQSKANFPIDFLPISKVLNTSDLSNVADLNSADLYLVYAAGGGMNIFDELNKKGGNMILFCRHKSGPVYLWYKIISPRYLRQLTDKLAVSYEELGKLISEAKTDKPVTSRAKDRADEYLKDSTITLETKRQFVENGFVLEDVFSRLMEKFECSTITINNCMGTIMGLSETSACLTLSLLNDAGYLAFCESDFVVVPTGVLLAHISGNIGLKGKIIDNPFMQICRSQIDISFDCESKLVAEKMSGFHWITVYGDYMKESAYALKKIGINFENLG